MKTIVNNITATDVIEVSETVHRDSISYIGYETDGGLRAYLTFINKRWGFAYYQEERNRLVFSSSNKEATINKAMAAGRELFFSTDLYEFNTWLAKTIPTRHGAKYLVNLAVHHNISIDDLLVEISLQYGSCTKEELSTIVNKSLTRDERIYVISGTMQQWYG